MSTVTVGWNTYNNKVNNLDALFEAAVEQAGNSGFTPATFFNNGANGNQGNYQAIVNKQQLKLPQPVAIPPNDSSVPDFLKPPAKIQNQNIGIAVVEPDHPHVGGCIRLFPDGSTVFLSDTIDPGIKEVIKSVPQIDRELVKPYMLDNKLEPPHYDIPNKTITPLQLFNQFLSGEGPRSRNFIKGDLMTEELRKHWWIQEGKEKAIKAYKQYQAEGTSGSLPSFFHNYNYKDNKWRAPYDFIGGAVSGEMTTPVLGSYACTVTIKDVIQTSKGVQLIIEFNVDNKMSNESYTRNPITGYDPNYIGSENYEIGPRSTIHMQFIWQEEVKIFFISNIPIIE
jgi:hypothetical protein